MRPNWDEYFLNIAEQVASRSTCLRAQYGSVIVKDLSIIATGYNGAPSNVPSCYDRKTCIRDQKGIPHGERYEICYSIHSEVNAILRANSPVIGGRIYIAGMRGDTRIDCTPCFMCKRIMLNARLATCVTRKLDGTISDVHVLDWANDLVTLSNERRNNWEPTK